ncbi:hypothetical protein trd_1292 [Thermomicrobium roseum DSM 5159]|uniref:Uncharacterized protein n=1 Tax=Thermomicrobium roseum (strain ATCC 27502 / DSM 5159 / P-2) TaxID=309801 RepID=B9L1N1_THERP|nr:hypothetical protein trd_1292 [Thermomicrobium roseum DSM 5159]
MHRIGTTRADAGVLLGTLVENGAAGRLDKGSAALVYSA